MSKTCTLFVKTALGAMAALMLFFGLLYYAIAGPPSNPQTPTVIDMAASQSFTVGQVAVGPSAAKLVKAAPTTGHSRFSIIIKNIGSDAFYIGPTSAVTSSTGLKVGASESLTLDRSYSAIYAITGTGDNSTLNYLEEYR